AGARALSQGEDRVNTLASLARWLAPRVRPSLRTLVLAFCAGDVEVLGRIELDRVVAGVAAHALGPPPPQGAGFLLAAWAMCLGLEDRRTEDQVRRLEAWAHSRLVLARIAHTAIRYACMGRIYSEPLLLDHIGYRKDRLARLEGGCTPTSTVTS